MVCMVNATASSDKSATTDAHGNFIELSISVNSTTVASGAVYQEGGEIEWSKSLQGLILSSFFYGYIVTQIPAGYLSGRFGGKNVILFGMLMNGVATLLVPVAARFDSESFKTSGYLVIALKIIMGLSSGVVVPAFHSLWGRWAPPLERSKLITLSSSGYMVGPMVMLAAGGFFCEWKSFAGGWPSMFYTGGGLCILFCPIWYFTVYNSPLEHPRISKKERNYILNSLEQKHNDESFQIPWKSIFTSIPVWAIIIAHTCVNFGEYTLLTKLPAFMDEVLDFNIQQNGLFSSLPYISMIIMANLAAQAVDKIRERKLLHTVTCRKICMTIVFTVPPISVIGLGYLPRGSQILGVILVTGGCGFQGFQIAGWAVNHIDIAPKHAGLLMGITNTFATIPGMTVPSLINALTKLGTVEEWRRVFFVWAGVYAFGGIFFAVFARGSIQEWAKHDKDMNKNESDCPQQMSPKTATQSYDPEIH